MKKRSIIIDTDPGIDDAVAIAVALFSKKLDVKLLTTVAGNVKVEQVTSNLLKLLKFWGKKIPVAMGASTPIIEPFVDASNVHGVSGLAGYSFPEEDSDLLLKENAVEAMRRVLEECSEKLTLVPIGPLTNIAYLLRLYPNIKEKIAEIVLMGGSTTRGNKGIMSEFNIATDPEAAKIVFSSGIPIVMAGLDVGWNALVYPDDSLRIKNLNKTGNMIYHLFQHYRGGSLKTGLKMYDCCAIAYLLEPEMFETVDTYVNVEIKGEYTRGVTLVDLKGYLKQESNTKVCINIDNKMFINWLMSSLEQCN